MSLTPADHAARAAVQTFLHDYPGMRVLLSEGLEELRRLVSGEVSGSLTVVQGDGDALLRVCVQCPDGRGAVGMREIFRAFDEGWWLHECHRSEGRLVFDYALESPDGSCGGGINGREYVAHLGL